MMSFKQVKTEHTITIKIIKKMLYYKTSFVITLIHTYLKLSKTLKLFDKMTVKKTLILTNLLK